MVSHIINLIEIDSHRVTDALEYFRFELNDSTVLINLKLIYAEIGLPGVIIAWADDTQINWATAFRVHMEFANDAEYVEFRLRHVK